VKKWLCLVLLAACDGELRFDDLVTVPHDAAAPEIDASAPEVVTPKTGCTGDPDCKLASLHCDTVAGTCVACVTDAHCGKGRCDAALHRCVECGVDGDCKEGKCEPVTRTCMRACDSLIGCHEEAPFCDFSRGVCIRCKTSIECIGEICDDANGRCVECTSDSQCRSERPRCDRTSGKCARCLSNADCAAGQTCDPETRSCFVI
jgi:Cys-rich repeat protein